MSKPRKALKWTRAICLILALCVCLFGCGKQASAPTAPAETESANKV